MPKHRGVFDRMKPATISLDDSVEWRSPVSCSLVHCSSGKRYPLNHPQALPWRLVADTGQNCFRDQSFYCIVEQGGKSAVQCSSSLPTPFDLAAQA